MAKIVISKETRAKLVFAAKNGQSVEVWMIQFIRCDQALETKLFQIAEDAKNWSFLISFSIFRAQQRRKVALKKAKNGVMPVIHKKPVQQSKPFASVSTFTPSKSINFEKCPLCSCQIPKRSLRDHMDLTCPNRGCRSDGAIVDSNLERKEGVLVTFCDCGVPAIVGDTLCYHCKHT